MITNQKTISVRELAETIREQRQIALIANLKGLEALRRLAK
jgi:hypothetical protein